MTLTAPSPQEATKYVLDKRLVWPHLNYVPHSGQRLIQGSSARHRVASCGRRFGKSKLGGIELVPYALHAKTIKNFLDDYQQQMRYWIVGPNYDDDEREWRVFYDACKKLRLPFDRPGTYNDTTGGNMQMSLWDGRFIVECRSSAHEESLDGEGLDGVLMVEAAKMKRVIWDKFIRPALADKHGWSLHTSTPEGKNHFYEHWQRGQSTLPQDREWASWRMPSWRNETIFPGGRQDPEILDMEADMSEERFNQEIGADFTDFVGRVFKAFDEEIHVKDLQYDPRYPVYLAIDYGWTNPTVVLLIQVDVWDNVYVLDEYRVTQRDIVDVANDLVSFHGGLATRAQMMYPDPASPSETSVLSRKLKVPVNKNTGGEKRHRIEAIRAHLKPIPETAPIEERLPKLFIDRSRCPGLIYEMNEYRYPDSKKETKGDPKPAKEDPLDKDDHGPEALGRFFRGHYGAPGEGTRRKARVRTSRMSS